MMPLLRLLLCLGLSVGHKTEVLTGTLPKPNIWADPGSVIALYTPVIIWCEGSWEALEYYLHKQHSTDPWDTQFPLERGNQAKFSILQMSKDFAGIYKCYYKSPAGKSEYSDTLELVITGFYDKPSLSVWPSPAVTSGESINMQCSSSLGFGRFILIQEGKQHISLTMDSQQNGRMSFQARFALDSVTANHSGTFRCYGYFRNDPHVWSTSSNPLDIFVSESKDHYSTHTENASQHEGHTVENVIRMIMAALVLVTLVILLLEACHRKKMGQDVIRR